MAVGNEVVGKFYFVARNIVGYSLFLGFASHSAVYNDASARFVVHDVGVLAQAVYDKARYGMVLEVKYVVRGAQHGYRVSFVWIALVVADAITGLVSIALAAKEQKRLNGLMA